MSLSSQPQVRRYVLPLLKRFAIDVNIAHHWVEGKRITLNTFRHKGYWYHGRKRELDSMMLFAEILRPGDNVAEVGGHIGYISLYFDDLTAPDGITTVFEPGSNNLPYIEHNTKQSGRIHLVKKAVGERVGTVTFYEDDLTGQNNSVVENFQGLETNSAFAFVQTEVNKVEVPITTLDVELGDTRVDFIKIDIEGGEWGALQGADGILRSQRPALMVEMQADEQAIYDRLVDRGYVMFDEQRRRVLTPAQMHGNIFCLHSERHQELLASNFSHA